MIFPIAEAYRSRCSNTAYASDGGADISCPVGTPIVAVGNGMIVYSERGHTPWGTSQTGVYAAYYGIDTPYSVKIRLDAPVNGYRYAWYTHLSELALYVPESQAGAVRVSTNHILGRTGRGRGVPHLHFTLAVDEGLENYYPPIALGNFLFSLAPQDVQEAIKEALPTMASTIILKGNAADMDMAKFTPCGSVLVPKKDAGNQSIWAVGIYDYGAGNKQVIAIQGPILPL